MNVSLFLSWGKGNKAKLLTPTRRWLGLWMVNGLFVTPYINHMMLYSPYDFPGSVLAKELSRYFTSVVLSTRVCPTFLSDFFHCSFLCSSHDCVFVYRRRNSLPRSLSGLKVRSYFFIIIFAYASFRLFRCL